MVTAEMNWLRQITGISRLQKIRDDDVRQALGIETTLQDHVIQQRFQWFGHVERMLADRSLCNSL